MNTYSAGSPSRRQVRRSVPLGLAVTLVAAALVAAGCSSGSAARRAGDAPAIVTTGSATSKYDGDVLGHPLALSHADLTVPFRSTAGGSTTLGRLGDGKLMLVYFGYTDCPDICPTTMADIGLALRQLPAQDQYRTQVVFVTSDPPHDTTSVMHTWLANFDSSLPIPFIGLTASISQIDKVAKSVGVPLSPPVIEPDGSISVEHGAQTMAFHNGRAGLLWLAGTTPAQYAHDIAALLDNGGSP